MAGVAFQPLFLKVPYTVFCLFVFFDDALWTDQLWIAIISMYPIFNKSTLAHIRPWHGMGDKPLSKSMMSLFHYA